MFDQALSPAASPLNLRNLNLMYQQLLRRNTHNRRQIKEYQLVCRRHQKKRRRHHVSNQLPTIPGVLDAVEEVKKEGKSNWGQRSSLRVLNEHLKNRPILVEKADISPKRQQRAQSRNFIIANKSNLLKHQLSKITIKSGEKRLSQSKSPIHFHNITLQAETSGENSVWRKDSKVTLRRRKMIITNMPCLGISKEHSASLLQSSLSILEEAAS